MSKYKNQSSIRLYPYEFLLCFIFRTFIYMLVNKTLTTSKYVSQWPVKHKTIRLLGHEQVHEHFYN